MCANCHDMSFIFGNNEYNENSPAQQGCAKLDKCPDFFFHKSKVTECRNHKGPDERRNPGTSNWNWYQYEIQKPGDGYNVTNDVTVGKTEMGHGCVYQCQDWGCQISRILQEIPYFRSVLPPPGGKLLGRTNLPYSVSQIVVSLRRHCDT